jgi:alkanesulfonate monooxygenase SsuD/methylene tetrahydromethanopterin reductase-like flavin-dependent oxidoreductase (luciferase family)
MRTVTRHPKGEQMQPHPIRFGLQTGQQSVQWSEMLDLWRKADAWGYDSLWNFDHFYPIFVDPEGPCFEGWTTLSALAQATSRARIGHMVNGNTYRHPCILAKMAATLDHISNGRLNLGIGAGWFELEHRSFGTDAMCLPPPVQQPHPPIMIGGSGKQVLLKLVATHADMWNSSGSAEHMRDLIGVIRRHGEAVGRDTDAIEKTVLMPMCYKAAAPREEFMCNLVANMRQVTPAEARLQIMIGDKQECLDTVGRYARAGVTHFIFMIFAPYFVDEVQGFAEDVLADAKRLSA